MPTDPKTGIVTNPVNLVNPGSVWQSYNPKTKTTSYGSAPSGLYSGTGQSVATPQNLPAGTGTPQVAQGQPNLMNTAPTFTNLTPKTAYVDTGTGISQNTEGKYEYKMPTILSQDAVSADSEVIKKSNDIISEATASEASAVDERYGQPANPRAEKSSADSLRRFLDSQTAGGKTLTSFTDANEWGTLVRAMTYGDYSAQDIANHLYSRATGKGDIFNLGQPRNQAKLPAGANPDVPETMTPPDPSILDEQTGGISELKFMQKLQDDLSAINEMIADTRESFDTSVNEIGNQVGQTQTLIQGEQVFQENRKNIRLQRLVDDKNAIIEGGNLQMKVYEYTRQLRIDQQNAMASIMDVYLKNGTPLPESMAKQYSQLTGISQEAISDAFTVSADNYLKQQALDLDTQMLNNDYTYLKTPAEVDAARNSGKTVVELGGRSYAKDASVADDSWSIENINGVDMLFNSTTGEASALSSNTNSLLQPGAKGGQCGAYPKKIMDNVPAMGDLFTEKMAITNTTVEEFRANPQAGDILIQQTKMPYGHVSVVKSIKDGVMTVVESNWNGDELVGERQMSVNDATVKGVYRGANFKTESTANQGASEWATAIKNGNAKLSDVPDYINKTDVIKAMGSSAIANEETITALTDLYDTAKDVLENPYLNNTVGANPFGRASVLNMFTGGKLTVVAQIKKLVSSESLKSLIDAKAQGATFGALSDRELEVLQSAATTIGGYPTIKDGDGNITGYKANQTDFEKELKRLKTSYANLLKYNGIDVENQMSTASGNSFTTDGGDNVNYDYKIVQ
jgi:hypothetical protein